MDTQIHFTDEGLQAAQRRGDWLMNEKDAAVVLGMSVKTLQQWRFYSKGPRYKKLGGKAVRYAMSDLQAYMDECAINPGVPA